MPRTSLVYTYQQSYIKKETGHYAEMEATKKAKYTTRKCGFDTVGVHHATSCAHLEVDFDKQVMGFC